MLVDGQAAADAEFNSGLNQDNVKLYEDLRSRPYCTNSYDSAVGGGFDICQAVGGDGQDIAQAIAEFKPIYEKKVADANRCFNDFDNGPWCDNRRIRRTGLGGKITVLYGLFEAETCPGRGICSCSINCVERR